MYVQLKVYLCMCAAIEKGKVLATKKDESQMNQENTNASHHQRSRTHGCNSSGS